VGISQMHQEVQPPCEVEIQHRVEVVLEEEVELELSDTQHRVMLGLNHISYVGVDKNINSLGLDHICMYIISMGNAHVHDGMMVLMMVFFLKCLLYS